MTGETIGPTWATLLFRGYESTVCMAPSLFFCLKKVCTRLYPFWVQAGTGTKGASFLQLEIPECFDSLDDALKAAVMALGGFKTVGKLLRPDFDHAAEWLRKCVASERRERLEPGQVLVILREAKVQGFHSAFDYFASAAGYKAAPVDAQREMQSLEQDIAAGLRSINARMARLELMKTRGLAA